MRSLLHKYKTRFKEPEFQTSMVISAIVFITGTVANFYAINFATEHKSNPVTDIILSNTPVLEVDGLFVYGTIILTIFIVAIHLLQPKRIPFGLYAVGLFWIVRSIFTSLTHIAPYEAQYESDFGPTITNAFFGGDLFFSGHTGMPFLGVLAFWHEKWIRYTLIGGTIFFVLVVLLGHLHYSIDVFSAFFITYGIYHIAIWLFPQEYKWFMSENEPEKQ